MRPEKHKDCKVEDVRWCALVCALRHSGRCQYTDEYIRTIQADEDGNIMKQGPSLLAKSEIEDAFAD